VVGTLWLFKVKKGAALEYYSDQMKPRQLILHSCAIRHLPE